MPRLRSNDVYPYSGWPAYPWTRMRGDDLGPYPTDVLDQDAAARSARRVTEFLNLAFFDAGVESKRGGYRMRMTSNPDSTDVIATRKPQIVSSGFAGDICVPTGFRLLLPDQRAAALTSAVHELLRPIAAAEQWESELERAINDLRAASYRCGWEGPWKTTRDRRLRARIVVELADDGYGRWRVQVAEGGESGALLRETEPMFGWTWILNYQKMAKGMRLTGPHVLELGTGSMFIHGITSVDLDTAAVIQLGTAEEEGATILEYPGEAGHPDPAISVEVYAPLFRTVRRDGVSTVEEY